MYPPRRLTIVCRLGSSLLLPTCWKYPASPITRLGVVASLLAIVSDPLTAAPSPVWSV